VAVAGAYEGVLQAAGPRQRSLLQFREFIGLPSFLPVPLRKRREVFSREHAGPSKLPAADASTGHFGESADSLIFHVAAASVARLELLEPFPGVAVFIIHADHFHEVLFGFFGVPRLFADVRQQIVGFAQ